jgi:hypothetical protein
MDGERKLMGTKRHHEVDKKYVSQAVETVVNPANSRTLWLPEICPTMRQYRQEDAHEFFRYGIDLLHNEALKVAKAT